ncbi:MAG: hypothetical protein MUC46_09900 [Desulfobacterales bacterium]|nr:hypothetical protein [Desulfobacterales bacterium]
MKKPLYDKMKAMFPLIGHDYREIGPLEDLLYRLALGNTFTSRIVGLDAVKRFRQENPGCAITFKPNHLSEADFIVLAVLFRTNGMRVVIEGGNNLFIDTVDIFRDVLPGLLNPAFAELAASHRMSIADYLTQRGSFKVFRNPITVTQPDGTEVKLGRKDILSLSRAYRQHLVEEKEMYLTFPGFSTVRSSLLDLIKMDGVKTGRTYTGRPVNLAYERVMEDENFQELTRMHEAGVDPQKIYFHDMGYIIRRFCADKRKVDLSVKFGEPRRVDARALKSDMLGTKIKFAAHAAAKEAFEQVMGMQPVFPANIYFSAFDERFSRLPTRVLRERIDDVRDRLRHLVWGRQRRRVDLHYVLGYRGQLLSSDEIINRTFEVFSPPERPVTSLDGDMFVVHNHDVAMQYRNHIAHFLEPAKK